jgi:hypothetical protein
MNLLCKLGFHRWGKSISTSWAFRSNVLDWKKTCKKCGKIKKWVSAKN